MRSKQTVAELNPVNTGSRVQSQLFNKTAKTSFIVNDRPKIQEKTEVSKFSEQKRLKELVGQFELDLSSKNITALQSLLESKKQDNESLRAELKELERRIREAETQIKAKQRTGSLPKVAKTQRVTNKDVENETTETRAQISELSKQIVAKTKNLKEYETKLSVLKQDFAKLPVETKKILVQELNHDQRFRKHLKEDMFLRSFFNHSDSSLDY